MDGSQGFSAAAPGLSRPATFGTKDPPLRPPDSLPKAVDSAVVKIGKLPQINGVCGLYAAKRGYHTWFMSSLLKTVLNITSRPGNAVPATGCAVFHLSRYLEALFLDKVSGQKSFV